MLLEGADAELLDEDSVRDICPFLDFNNARFPIKGGLMQSVVEQFGTMQLLGGMQEVLTIRVLI